MIWIFHHHFLLILILSLILQLNVIAWCVLINIFQFGWACLLERSRRHVLHQLHLWNSSRTTKGQFLWSIWLLTLERQFSIIGLAEQMIATILVEHHGLRVIVGHLGLLPALVPLRLPLHVLTCAFDIIWWIQMVNTSFHSCFTWLSRFTSFVWWFLQVAFVTIFI